MQFMYQLRCDLYTNNNGFLPTTKSIIDICIYINIFYTNILIIRIITVINIWEAPVCTLYSKHSWTKGKMKHVAHNVPCLNRESPEFNPVTSTLRWIFLHMNDTGHPKGPKELHSSQMQSFLSLPQSEKWSNLTLMWAHLPVLGLIHKLIAFSRITCMKFPSLDRHLSQVMNFFLVIFF